MKTPVKIFCCAVVWMAGVASGATNTQDENGIVPRIWFDCNWREQEGNRGAFYGESSKGRSDSQ